MRVPQLCAGYITRGRQVWREGCDEGFHEGLDPSVPAGAVLCRCVSGRAARGRGGAAGLRAGPGGLGNRRQRLRHRGRSRRDDLHRRRLQLCRPGDGRRRHSQGRKRRSFCGHAGRRAGRRRGCGPRRRRRLLRRRRLHKGSGTHPQAHRPHPGQRLRRSGFQPQCERHGLLPGPLGLDPLRGRRLHLHPGGRRTHIAALRASTGAVKAWHPNANGEVDALAVSGSTVYAGGNFSAVGGKTRHFIAALRARSGRATAWDPPPTARSTLLAVSGSTVYAGGSSRSIGGQNRSFIAALSSSSGAATAWDSRRQRQRLRPRPSRARPSTPAGTSPPSAVRPALHRRPRHGQRPRHGLEPQRGPARLGARRLGLDRLRRRLLHLHRRAGPPSRRRPERRRRRHGLESQGKQRRRRPRRRGQNRLRRRRLQLDRRRGAQPHRRPWPQRCAPHRGTRARTSPSTPSPSRARPSMPAASSPRSAARPATTSPPSMRAAALATSWNPGANNHVHALAVSGSTVYAGGNFTSIGGQTRSRIAALDASSGLATAWNPAANGRVVRPRRLGLDRLRRRPLHHDRRSDPQRHRRPRREQRPRHGLEPHRRRRGRRPRRRGSDRLRRRAVHHHRRPEPQRHRRPRRKHAGWPRPGTRAPTARSWPSPSRGRPSTPAASSARSADGLATMPPPCAQVAPPSAWNPAANAAVDTLAVSGSKVYAGGLFTTIGGQPHGRTWRASRRYPRSLRCGPGAGASAPP